MRRLSAVVLLSLLAFAPGCEDGGGPVGTTFTDLPSFTPSSLLWMRYLPAAGSGASSLHVLQLSEGLSCAEVQSIQQEMVDAGVEPPDGSCEGYERFLTAAAPFLEELDSGRTALTISYWNPETMSSQPVPGIVDVGGLSDFGQGGPLAYVRYLGREESDPLDTLADLDCSAGNWRDTLLPAPLEFDYESVSGTITSTNNATRISIVLDAELEGSDGSGSVQVNTNLELCEVEGALLVY